MQQWSSVGSSGNLGAHGRFVERKRDREIEKDEGVG